MRSHYAGNGRTARTLATLLLYRHGYDLGRFYSLEEVYIADLAAYYAALQTHRTTITIAGGQPPT